MNKLLSITVRGNQHTYAFTFEGDPKYLAEWREDGLEINELVNIIPEWVVDLGLTKPWIFLQDLWNFKI